MATVTRLSRSGRIVCRFVPPELLVAFYEFYVRKMLQPNEAMKMELG